MAERLRIATYNVELSREGPGLLLRDTRIGTAPDVEAAAKVIAAAAPDVLVLKGVDYDLEGAALGALAERIAAAGHPMAHRAALRPNTGMATGLDLDGDGQLGGPGDAQGFGRFAGEGGMAVLSRLPLGEITDYSDFLWADLPGNLMDGAGQSPEARAVQRLSTNGHWAVQVLLDGGRNLTLLTWHATPPVFDGPEDRNGRRNHDEAAFWSRLLDGALPYAPPPAPFVLLGDANLDPVDGEGRPAAIRALLADPRLQAPRLTSAGGTEAARLQGGANAAQRGDPAEDTADWADDPGPGNLRASVILPSAGPAVDAAGVFWPETGQPLADEVAAASRHHLLWVDLDLP